MDNEAIAAVLEDVASLMELNGENPFRSRTYANAAREIEMLEEPVVDIAERDALEEVKGIGKTLAKELSELVKTGRIPRYEKLLNEVPEGLLEMREIPGLGAKRLRTIYESLGVSDIDVLAKACASGAVEELKGFGKKSAKTISEGIEYLQAHRGRYLVSTARAEAAVLLDALRSCEAVVRVGVAGSIRRCTETTKDVDLVASASDSDAAADAFVGAPTVEAVISKGDTKVAVRLKSGLNADLRIVEDDVFANAMHHFTGSKDHNTEMRRRAKARALKLNEYGLFDGERRISCPTEEDVYAALDLAYIPPELREGRGEIERAEAGPIPPLVEMGDLRGTLHVHTQFSDGRSTIEAMATAARDLGHSYIGICDHSRAAAYAGGLDEDRVRAQWEEIDVAQAKVGGIRILRGIEVDIMADGSLDFEDAFLSEFEVVVASVHSIFGMDREAATARIVRAVQSPYVDILGHPTGRLLLSRDGYPLDIPRVIEGAAKGRTAIEINAHPRRLELDWCHLSLAKERGVKIAINTDAHGVEGLNDLAYGVGIARKGGVQAEDVLNALKVDAFLAWRSGAA